MARHWGGDGIEEFLGPGESVMMRWGNFFLTQSRLGIYLTLKSKFLLTELSDLSIRKNKRTKLRASFAGFGIILAIIFTIGELVQPAGLVQSVVTLFLGAFTIVLGYGMLSSLDLDSYIVSSARYGKSWKIRTSGLENGLIFVDNLVNAINRQTR